MEFVVLARSPSQRFETVNKKVWSPFLRDDRNLPKSLPGNHKIAFSHKSQM